MAEDVQGTGGDELQFSAVETATPGQVAAAPVCVACKRPIADQYFAAGDKMVCPTCRNQYESALASGSKLARVGKATALGIGAGIVGAAVWFAIRRATHYDLALVSIAVGFAVGIAVRAGSGGRGGRGYQFLALLLTYLAVALNYSGEVFWSSHPRPSTVQTAKASSPNHTAGGSTQVQADDDDDEPAPRPRTGAQIVLTVGVLLALPVMLAFQSILSALIIGFALWEAWKINAGRRLSLAGPYSLAGGGLGIPQPLPPIAPGAQG